MSLRRALLCALACACLHPQASAHIYLERGEPRVGATVAVAPKEVKLWFSARVGPDSTVRVLDRAGSRVDMADARVDAKEPGLLRVSVRTLEPGTYTVVWRAVSTDTHATQGDFSFRVRP